MHTLWNLFNDPRFLDFTQSLSNACLWVVVIGHLNGKVGSEK